MTLLKLLEKAKAGAVSVDISQEQAAELIKHAKPTDIPTEALSGAVTIELNVLENIDRTGENPSF